jgi:hypothetical protein
LKKWIWVVFVGLTLGVKAQKTNVDSLRKVKVPIVVGDTLQPYDTVLKVDSLTAATMPPERKLIPKRATFYALLVPGGGQVYNRDFWKLPIVYGAFGAAIYTIRWNTLRYNDFLQPYLSSVDPDTGKPIGKTEFDVYIRGRDETRTLSLDQIKRGKTFYRRYREYGYVILAAVYALSAIEANVAAHLKTFDLSEDLSLRLEPSMEKTFGTGSAAGVKLVLAIK